MFCERTRIINDSIKRMVSELEVQFASCEVGTVNTE
jgi:hypothetical protein